MKDFTLNRYKVLGLIMILIIWAFAHMIIGNSVILPSPLETVLAFKETVLSQDFGLTILTTLSRILFSFLLGLALALVFGTLSALNQRFYDLLSPSISLFKILPTMAIIILALIWLSNERAPILISVIVIGPILYEAVIKGIRDVDSNILSMIRLYKVKTIDVVRYVYIPSILANIGAIFSSTLGLCLKIVIGGEVLGQPRHSIGTSIQMEKMFLNTAGVLGWIIILVIISMAIDLIAKLSLLIIKAIRRGIKNGKTVY